MGRAVELAWESFRAGSFPVGAVLVDGRGEVVAEGRNRMGEGEAPAGRMRSTGIAHAEMDVLAQLPMGDYPDHTLFTSLEPCLLCRAALTMTHVGTVRFLAGDSLCEGLDQLRDINAHASRRYPVMEGPGDGIVAAFAGALPMAVLLLFNPTGTTADHYRLFDPVVFARAQRIVAENRWPSKALDVQGAVESLVDVLE